MLTVIESLRFQALVDLYLNENSFSEFKSYLANHPEAGEVIPLSGGVRKIRWRRAGMGKSGGVRIIYFTRINAGELILLTIYAKAKFDNIPPDVARKMRAAYENP